MFSSNFSIDSCLLIKILLLRYPLEINLGFGVACNNHIFWYQILATDFTNCRYRVVRSVTSCFFLLLTGFFVGAWEALKRSCKKYYSIAMYRSLLTVKKRLLWSSLRYESMTPFVDKAADTVTFGEFTDFWCFDFRFISF